MRVVIMGNGIVANLGALYFRKILPASTEIVVIGPEDRGGMPLVGESIIEITTHFIQEHLGLGEYLRQNHLPKYALTYYFKMDPANPDDRTYSVHCAERGPADRPRFDDWQGPMDQPASWLLNRTVFDRDLHRFVAETPGIQRIPGCVRDATLSGRGHELEVEAPDGSMQKLHADWLIDCTGRARFLGKKLDLTVRPSGQRDCFWFRLADFDRSMLTRLTALGPNPPGPGEEYHYDRYYSTHHFLGRGNWIWMIPMKGEDGKDEISIGLVSHPDHYEHDVRTIEDFIEHVSKVHPVVTDLVKQGRVLDTNVLRRYHYVSSRFYSPDRWAVVGDAAFAPDPMFSNGLAYGTMQLEQLGHMMLQDLAGKLTPELVDGMNGDFSRPLIASQAAITNWYEHMHDPYLSSLRLNWIEVTFFYMFLPLVMNRCHYEPERSRLWKAMTLRVESNPFEIPKKLKDAGAMVRKVLPEHFIYDGVEKVNPRALAKVKDDDELWAQINAGHEHLKAYTEAVYRRVWELATPEDRAELDRLQQTKPKLERARA